MVLKGAKARKLKSELIVGRPERSLYVSFSNKNKLDRSKVVEILEVAHSQIEHVFLPRQKIPKFVYVLCKTSDDKGSVRKSLNSLKNEELGPLNVQNAKERKEKPKSETSAAPKQKIDPRCLLLEFLPKEVTDGALEEAFPEAEKIDRFNKRRCYLHFKNAKDAMKARVRIAKEKIGGHSLKVKFNKVEVITSDEGGSDSS